MPAVSPKQDVEFVPYFQQSFDLQQCKGQVSKKAVEEETSQNNIGSMTQYYSLQKTTTCDQKTCRGLAATMFYKYVKIDALNNVGR